MAFNSPQMEAQSVDFFKKKYFFIPSEGGCCLFSLRNLHNGTSEVPGLSRGWVFPGSSVRSTLPFIDNVDTLFALLLASDAATLVSFLHLENYVLMSVGFITWVGKLNPTCYTPLNAERPYGE